MIRKQRSSSHRAALSEVVFPKLFPECRLTRITAFLLALAVTACASGGTNTPQRDRVIATGDAVILRDDGLQFHDPPLPLGISTDSALRVLSSVYDDLGIEVKLWNPAYGLVGNRDFTKYHQLAHIPIGTFLRCGTTQLGEAADSYRINMSLVSRAEKRGEIVEITSKLEARADDPGSSKGWVSCVTTGRLEQRIKVLVLKKVGG